MVNKYVHISINNKLKMYDAPFIYKFKTHYNVTLGAIEEFFLQNNDSTVIRYKLQLTILILFTYDVHTVQYVHVPYTVSTGHMVLYGRYWYHICIKK